MNGSGSGARETFGKGLEGNVGMGECHPAQRKRQRKGPACARKPVWLGLREQGGKGAGGQVGATAEHPPRAVQVRAGTWSRGRPDL